jgi:DNA-binding NarL/FixJ family response regulator
MPEVPGDEVLAAVHDRPGNYRVAILTAVEDAEVVELPFDVYLTKPVTRADPVATVSRLVTRQSLEAGLGRQERLLATCDALSARPEGALTEALCAVEEDIAANHESVCGDPEDLDDRYVAWSLVERE